MIDKKRCSCCNRLLPLHLFWKHKSDPPLWHDHSKKEYHYHKCKDCCLKEIDINNINTILPLFKEFNVPYLESEWNRIKTKFPQNPIPRYLALMRLCGYYNFEFNDSDKLNEIHKQKEKQRMIDIKRKKVKAIYFNAFHCPECGLELHKDNIVLTTYPAQYCYFCDCGFRTTSFQQPGYEYEFEDENDISEMTQSLDKYNIKNNQFLMEYLKQHNISIKDANGEFKDTEMILNEIADAWNNIPLQSFIHTTDTAIVEDVQYV